jgi:hypothetical protein
LAGVNDGEENGEETNGHAKIDENGPSAGGDQSAGEGMLERAKGTG